MAYGLKYQTQFSSQSDANNASMDYVLEFLFKDYVGGEVSIIGGETTVIQRATDDNPVAAIKGQSLDITLLNKGNSLPISSFFSEDDDGIMVKLKQGGNVLFVGFLVQDDFSETMVDYTHSITLTATDNLGLLKGVILSEAEVRRAFQASYRTNGVDTVVYMYVTDLAFYPQAGNTIEIDGNSYIIDTAINETTLIGIAYYNWTVTLTTTTGGIAQTVDTVYLTGEVDLIQRNSLLSLLAVCLSQTNLTLITNIFMNLYEYTQDNTISTFEQTMLDSQLFIKGESFEDCYTALSKILSAFHLTLIQANGQWNLVHWHEMRNYTNNACPSFQYDETWGRLGTGLFTNNFVIGPDPQLTRPIYELTQTAMRGYKFSRKQFNYNTPKYLLKNYDLLTLGDLIQTYTSGSEQISEYVATDWQVGVGPIYSEYFIRVVVDIASQTETDRYLVIRDNCSDTTRAIASNNIEAQEKDKLVFSFSTRTGFSQPPTFGGVFAVRLTDNTTTRYVDDLPVDNGDWIPTVGFSYSFTSNTDQWTNVEIKSSQIPFDGLVNCFLAQNNGGALNDSRETHYKDIRFTYIQYINDSVKIIGHAHKQEQPPNKKLNADIEIEIDDSPRNSIVGTLFLPTFNGLLQSRTTYWRYPPDANGWRLGELTTLEELRWKQRTRLKFEGGFIGNYQNGTVISLLTMVQETFNPTKNYTFGMLSIDYKRNQFSGTLWELYDTDDPELDNTYSYTYIYEAT